MEKFIWGWFFSSLDVNTYLSVEIFKIYAHGFVQLKVIAVQQEEKKAVDRLKERYKDENESITFTSVFLLWPLAQWWEACS